VSVDLMTDGGAQETPLSGMERLYQSWGVSPGKTVVLYDQGGTYLGGAGDSTSWPAPSSKVVCTGRVSPS
jgi:hypothetical protein